MNIPAAFRRYREGEISAFGDERELICEGDWFKWPLWKQVVARLIVGPYSHFYAIRESFRRFFYLPWTEHRHPSSICLDLLSHYQLVHDWKQSEILPIFWRARSIRKD